MSDRDMFSLVLDASAETWETYQAAANDYQQDAVADMEHGSQAHPPLYAVVWAVHDGSDERVLPDNDCLCDSAQRYSQQANQQTNDYGGDAFDNCVGLQPAWQRRVSIALSCLLVLSRQRSCPVCSLVCSTVPVCHRHNPFFHTRRRPNYRS